MHSLYRKNNPCTTTCPRHKPQGPTRPTPGNLAHTASLQWPKLSPPSHASVSAALAIQSTGFQSCQLLLLLQLPLQHYSSCFNCCCCCCLRGAQCCQVDCCCCLGVLQPLALGDEHVAADGVTLLPGREVLSSNTTLKTALDLKGGKETIAAQSR